MHWRGKWQPAPVFLPGESQGRGSLVGCRLWGRTESVTTEVTQQQQQQPSMTQVKRFCQCNLNLPINSIRINQMKAFKRQFIKSLIFLERTDAEVQAPVLWPPDAKSQIIGKDPDAGKD